MNQDNAVTPTDLVALKAMATAPVSHHSPKATAIEPGQTEAEFALWTAPEGHASTGIWEATPGSFTARREGHHEICQLLAGRVRIESSTGDVVELGAGDLFVMPNGWSGVWHVLETVRKTYIIIDVPA